MSICFILCTMIFAHVIADYNLQGILALMKQKSWWSDQIDYSKKDCKKYLHDYIAALIMHGLSWSFMVMLPVAIYFNFQCSWWFGIAFLVNALVHAVIDHWKANKKSIDLVQDQCLHMLQIFAIFVIIY